MGLVWRWTKRLVQTLVVLLVAFFFIFKIPAVQNWLAKQAASFLSSELGTVVKIDRVEIELFNKAIFENLYVEDLHGDTLIFAPEVKAYFDLGFSSIWNKRLDISKAEVNDAIFNYIRPAGERDFNLYFIIRYFDGSGKKNGKSNPVHLNIREAIVRRANILFFDAAVGTEVRVKTTLFHAISSNDSTNLARKVVRADSAFLDSTWVAVRQVPRVPLPPRPVKSSDTSAVDTTIPTWNIAVGKMRIQNTFFKLRNELQPVHPERDLDFTDLKVNHIRMDIDTFSMYKGDLRGKVLQLAAHEQRGFSIQSMFGDVFVNSKHVAITDFKLRTPHSVLGDSLFFDYSTYSDFQDFVNKVRMTGNLKHSTITLRDIIAFAPALKNDRFFSANYNTKVQIQGRIRGTVNNLKARDITLKLGNYTVIQGYMSLNDITIPDAGFMDLSFDDLRTTSSDLAKILPFVKLPPQLDRLGLMQFKGNYTGYFKDFVAFGRLNTALGAAQSDLKMNLRGGLAGATYSGHIQFEDFDLGAFLDNDNLGKIGLHTDLKGKGLTPVTMNMVLNGGQVDSFVFKEYSYRDVLISGNIQHRRFEGTIISNDRNCDLTFTGIADLRDTLPHLDFRGGVRNVNFHRLNIADAPLTLRLDSFDIEAIGTNLSNLKGYARLDKIHATRFGQDFKLDSIRIVSEDSLRFRRIQGTASFDSTQIDTVHYIKLRSDIAFVRIAGVYDMVNLPRALARHVKEFYPNLFKNLQKAKGLNIAKLAAVDSLNPAKDQRFRLRIEIDSTQNWTQFLDTSFRYLSDVRIHTYFNSNMDTLYMRGNVGGAKVGNIKMSDIVMNGNGQGRYLALNNTFTTLQIGDSTMLPSFRLNLNTLGDTLKFETGLSRVGQVASNISLAGQASFSARTVDITLDTAHVNIFNHPWIIRGDNSISIGADKLAIRNVRLTNENQLVELSNLGTRGIALCVQQMNLKWLYDLVKLPQIDIEGTFSADLRISDIFRQKNLSANFYLDSLIINKDRWGRSVLNVHSDSIQAPIYALLQHKSPFVDTLWVDGYYFPPFATKDPKKKNTMDFNFEFKGAKASIISYFLPTQLSGVEGWVDVNGGRIFGQAPRRIAMAGTGFLHQFGTQVNFLKTRYRVPYAQINLASDGFKIVPDAKFNPTTGEFMNVAGSGAVVLDERGDTAKIWGGITHDYLRNFRLDLHFHLDNNLVLNTTKNDNTTFYGKVFADADVDFVGEFNRLRLSIDGKTRDSSIVVLPLDDPLQVEQVNYITFVDKKLQNEENAKPKRANTSGITVELNAELTPEAVVQMVFDERTGEIMQGQGAGNLRMTYNSSGEFGMFGGYQISKGSYLFSYQNLTKKNFVVNPGGTIVWNGDPYEANLDIQAAYKQGANLNNLLSEYLADADAATKGMASKQTDVELLMNVRGKLLSPDITFDIAVPNVAPQLRSYTDLAIKAVRANQNELNRQVFGLVALQQFLPLENNGGRGQGVDFVSTSVNTLTELISGQLSDYLTDLVREVVDEVDFISSFEIDVDLRMRDQSTNNASTSRNSQVNVGLDQTFFNNRVRLYMGANLDLGNNSLGNVSGNSQSYIGGDFIVEYNLTEDGRFKVRGYNRPESAVWGRVIRSGVGVSYRTEFDSFSELSKNIKDGFKFLKRKRKKKQKQPEKADPNIETTTPTTTPELQ